MGPHAKSNLNVIYWNARSIHPKIHEFYQFLEDHFIHVACVNETHLNSKVNLPSHPDFFHYRLDREDSPMGGVAIFIRRNIKHNLLQHHGTAIIECIGLEVLCKNGAKIQITSAYLPGGLNHDYIKKNYRNDIKKLTTSNVSYFVCGDFNSRSRHWNCSQSNTAGKILYETYANNDFDIMFPDTHTRYADGKRGRPSTIDLMLTNGKHQTTELESVHALTSDHNVVKFTIIVDGSVEHRSKRLTPDYHNADWDRYRALIHFNIKPSSLNLEQITSTDMIDGHVENIEKLICHARDKAIPLTFRDQYKLNIPDSVKKEITTRNQLRRHWQRTREPRIKTTINRLDKKIKREINEIRNTNWNAKLADIKPSNQSVWKTARMIKNKNKGIPPLKINEKIHVTATEKAEIIGEQFYKNHQNPLENENPEFTAAINNQVEDFFSNINNEQNFTCDDLPDEEEVLAVIKKLKNPKAPGIDRINNILLKKLPMRGINYILFIMTACMKFSYFPAKWKHAKVVPIPKPGKDLSDPSNYRPISLLCSMSKILERILLARINKHLNEHEILPPEQLGFKAKFSTTHQLHNLISQAKESLAHKESTGIIFLDIEKAFDRVWHNGMLAKMIDLQFPGYIIKMVRNLISNRTFHVEIFGKKSQTHEIRFGVPQGAVTSPTLHNISTYDIPKIAETSIALFADDTAFFCSSPSAWNIAKNLRKHAKVMNEYMRKWKININNKKTQALFITNRRKKQLPKSTIRVFNEDIKWQLDSKYLGMVLGKKLNFKKHIEYVIGKSNVAIRTLYPLISRKSQLNVKNKLLIYKLAIRPIFTYACPAFINIAKTHIKKLQILQNKTLRMVMNKSRFERTNDIHQEANVPLVSDYINKLTEKFNQIQ